MNNIGKTIKDARIKKGYTQEMLAEMVGVKKSAVAKWENGRVSEIKRSNLNMLSKALGINPNSLLDDIEEEPVGMAIEHADILLDTELMELIAEYQALKVSDKKLVRDYVRFLKGRS